MKCKFCKMERGGTDREFCDYECETGYEEENK